MTSSAPTEKFFGKNTMGLQWKKRANYNARPCAGEGKAAGAGTMGNNAKNKCAEQSEQSYMTAGTVACDPSGTRENARR
jgi:hypothetical protein